MTVLISHFSTSFWEVSLMPAIRHPSTRAPGLRSPLRKQLLDYHSTINLAGCSRLLHPYRFISIKYKMLVTPYIPHCLTNCGLKTLFFVSNNRFLLMTLFSLDNRSAAWATGLYKDRCELSKEKLAARVGFEPTLSWVWQKTDYCCSSHTFWVQECYPPSMLSVALYSHFLYPP